MVVAGPSAPAAKAFYGMNQTQWHDYLIAGMNTRQQADERIFEIAGQKSINNKKAIKMRWAEEDEDAATKRLRETTESL